jgi:gliding motility-associated-like protein
MRLTLLFSLLLFGLTGLVSHAQTPVGLVAFYQFNGDLTDQTGNTFNRGVSAGVVEYGCGVNDNALFLTGTNDFVRIPVDVNNANVNREFDTEDFTLSFFFKPVGTSGLQYLISKRDTFCDLLNYFAIRYAPLSRTVSVELRNDQQMINISEPIRNSNCWQQLVLMRDNRRVYLYLNGREVANQGTTTRIDIENLGDLLIGGGNCRTQNETTFSGLIDELRVYNRALNRQELEELFLQPDRIVTEDSRIFLGEDIDLETASNCGISYVWDPQTDLSDPLAANPVLTPRAAGNFTYRVRISDNESSCVVVDSVRVQVIDPATLDCNAVSLPAAFTPNGRGPTANETFGISNPFAVPELLSFEILDRWGGLMFQTNDPFQRWDGTFRNEPVNPGVFLYRLRFICDGEEQLRTGSVTLLR